MGVVILISVILSTSLLFLHLMGYGISQPPYTTWCTGLAVTTAVPHVWVSYRDNGIHDVCVHLHIIVPFERRHMQKAEELEGSRNLCGGMELCIHCSEVLV